MNSEELEVSLRTEFENYLKNVFADIRQEISQLQAKIETELENHKSQLDTAFKDAMSRAEEHHNFDAGFKDSVVEHLRQARDEGARITAEAFAEAEKLDKQHGVVTAPVEFAAQPAVEAVPTVGVKELNAAISDISSKSSQADILKMLVQHASQFAPRGAFFIIKNEQFVGWKTFGTGNDDDDEAVREISMPVASDSIFSESVRSLATVESNSETYSDDAATMEKLEFGAPEKMFAVPLVARGRGVAVLYADGGADAGEVNIEALETMVRVAGLTVELHASARPAPAVTTAPKKRASAEYEAYSPSEEQAHAETGFEAVQQVPAEAVEEVQPTSSFQEEQTSAEESESQGFVSDEQETQVSETAEETIPTYEDSGWSQPAETAAEYSDSEQKLESETAESSVSDYDSSHETAVVEEEVSEEKEYAFEPTVIESDSPASTDFAISPTSENFEYSAPQTDTFAPVAPEESSFEPAASVAEPEPATVSAKPAKSRLSERNVDLPIEVSEDERRLHNDARRFARLLVSEIKLYNEQKVKEGREANDLYERLREAIDRSREMYDKRVQPPVAAKFDYFNYELVNTLAEGDSRKLGESYQEAHV